MAIFPIQFPPIAPASEWLRIQNKQSNQTAQFTGKTTVIQNYSAWTLDFAFGRMDVARAQIVASWTDQLQGSFGTFTYVPSSGVYPVLVPLTLSTPGYVTTNEVTVAGWNAISPTGLRVGQYITIGSQLLRIAATSLAADSSGHATIEFYPALRSDFGAGSTVETETPFGVFRLVNDSSNNSGSGFQLDPDFVPEFSTMSAAEDI